MKLRAHRLRRKLRIGRFVGITVFFLGQPCGGGGARVRSHWRFR